MPTSTMNKQLAAPPDSTAAAEKAARVERILKQHPNKMLLAINPKGVQQVPCKKHSDDGLDNYNSRVVTAVRKSNLEELKELLQEEQCFEACNNNGEYLIHLACRQGDLNTIKFLVHDAQVNVNVRDDIGRTVFHDVCWRPKAEIEIFDFLIKVVDPAFLMFQDVRGHTPFDYSRDNDWPKWNRFLLQHRYFLLKQLTASS